MSFSELNKLLPTHIHINDDVSKILCSKLSLEYCCNIHIEILDQNYCDIYDSVALS